MKIGKQFEVLCVVAALAVLLPLPFVVVNADVAPGTPIHVTPPAPVLDDAPRAAVAPKPNR